MVTIHISVLHFRAVYVAWATDLCRRPVQRGLPLFVLWVKFSPVLDQYFCRLMNTSYH